MATKPLTAVERARRKEIRVLIHRAKNFAKLNPHMDIAQLLDDLADVAEEYLKEIKE